MLLLMAASAQDLIVAGDFVAEAAIMPMVGVKLYASGAAVFALVIGPTECLVKIINVVRRLACIPQISASNITTMNLGVPEYGFRGNSKPDRRIARGHLDVVLQS
jgi:hypothetical protein